MTDRDPDPLEDARRRRPPDEDAPVLLQRRRPVAGRHVGHEGARRAGADLLEDEPGRAGGDRRRRAPHRGPRGRQDRRGGEVPHDALDHGDGPRLADPRRDRADPPAGAGDDRPARRGRGRRRPRLAQRAGPRARAAAARGGGVPAPRDARLRRDVRPHRRARRRGLAARLEDRVVGRRRPTGPCTATTGSSWRRTRTPSSSPGSTTRAVPAAGRSPATGSSTSPTAARACTRRPSPRATGSRSAPASPSTPGRRRRRRERRPAAPRRVLRGGPRRARLLDPRRGGALVPLPAGVAVTTRPRDRPGLCPVRLAAVRRRPAERRSGSRPTTCSSGRCGRAGCPTSSSSRRSSPTGWRSAPRCSTRSCWAGRFAEAAHRVPVVMLPRRAVKLALCGDSRAKDANIRQALIDRFGGSAAVGRKAAPGPAVRDLPRRLVRPRDRGHLHPARRERRARHERAGAAAGGA